MAKDEKPIFRRCAKCKILKEKKQFPGAFQVAKKFENFCRECIRGYLDSLTHPVERGLYVGPPHLAPNLDPDLKGCTLCDWNPKRKGSHKLCSACVTALLTATVESKLKLFELFYAEAQLRGEPYAERFEWLNRLFGPQEDLMEETIEEVHKYQKEDWHGKPKRSEDRGFLHRGSITKKPVNREEDSGRAESTKKIPLYQREQDKEALLFTGRL